MKWKLSDNKTNKEYFLEFDNKDLLFEEFLKMQNFTLSEVIETKIAKEKVIVNGDESHFPFCSLQGFIESSYRKLVKVLGEPKNNTNKSPNIGVYWTLEFPDDFYCYIYDWQTEGSYEDVLKWHISSRQNINWELLRDFLGLPTETA